jgi:chitodextrinase
VKRRIIAAVAAVVVVAGTLGLVGVTPASAAYASNGEPVWIPRNATNTADLLRADNRALAKVGNVVYVGGDFTELAPELGAPAVQQANLAAFNATTGVPIASFAPQLDGKVYAMVASADGTALYVGGSFTGGFAILDPTTGQPKGPQVTSDGEVHALYLDGASTLYVGGQFQKFGGVNNRKMMAKLATASLTVDTTFAPQFVGGMVDAIDISPDHNRLYAGGRFTTLNNVAVGKVVALSQVNGSLDSSFNPPLNTTKQPVEDIEALNTKVFVAFGGGYNRFVQFNAATGAQEYGSCGDGDVQEVHLVSDGVGGTVVLVGGHFAGNPKKNCTLDTIPTARIAEYRVDDTAGSLPVVVNPTPFSNVYANELGVWEFLGTSLTDIWLAGDFLKVSSRNTGGLAHFFDGQTYTDGQNPSIPGNVQVTAPTPGGFTVSWSASTDNKGVAGYYVVVDGVRRATSLGTSAVVTGLNPGVTSTVQVQAFDVKVNLSALSAGVPGTTLTDAVPPSAPTNLRVLNGSTSELVLGWNAAVDNGTVTEYQLYADGALLGTTSGVSLAHSNLTPGSQHTYQVTAKDAGGNVSPPSATLTARAYSVVLKAGPTTVWKYRDLGALPDFTWRDAAYDDSGWASGKAPLGYGKADITANGTTLGWGPSNSNRYLTSYARTTFTLADPTGITGMALKLRGTDGAAVFVNGRLAYNDNLPAALEPDLGALTARDTAALDIARELRVPVSSGMLVAGTNVVAVEFHKYAPNSTYLAFDTELSLGLASAATPPPSPPTGVAATAIAGPKVQVGWDAVAGAASYVVLRNGTQVGTAATPGFTDDSPPSGTTLSYTVRTVDDLGRTSSDSTAATVSITPPAAPANLTATLLGGPSVQLAWDAVGGASSYVVLRGGSLLATVPSPGYTDPSPGTGTITYTVRAVDAIGQQSADSAPASVTISTPPADTTAPTVPGKPVLVAGSVTDTAASFTWTASTDNVGVTGYRIFRDGVDVGTSLTASFTAAGLAPSTLYKFKVAAFDAAGNQSAKSTALQLTTTAAASGGAINVSTPWSYSTTRADPGATWKDPTFVVPASWKTGVPQFGFGDGDEATLLDRGGTTSSTGIITWYFRATFDVPNPAAVTGLAVSLIRDDGAAVYVNGVEVFRNNLPVGALSFTTKASAGLGGADEKNPITFSVPVGMLQPGTNVIAVELHNAGPTNADASFQLTAAFS